MKKCNKCQQIKNSSEFYKHKRRKDGLTTQCINCIKIYNKKKYKENREYNIARSKKWREDNPEKYKQWRRDNYYKKYNSDMLYKMEKRLRKRLWQSLQNKKWRKDNSFIEYIGCSLSDLKWYIENQFLEGMNWDNYGLNGWHIDHIIPLSLATSEEELKQLQHYSNLQPLWAIDNLRKYNKVI